MTTMIIDNKATAKKSIEVYTIDREEYPTIEDLRNLVFECMNEEAYMIRVLENDVELFAVRNYK